MIKIWLLLLVVTDACRPADAQTPAPADASPPAPADAQVPTHPDALSPIRETFVLDPDQLANFIESRQPIVGQNGKLTGCGPDFGLLLPLFGVSNRKPNPVNPNQRNQVRISLPIDSGIGGGYYLPLNDCNTRWSIDFDLFTFSEGLDPSKKFQLGVGAGFSLAAFSKFQVGIGLGFDLVRFETIDTGGLSRTYLNGLLVGNDVFSCRGGSSYADCFGRNITLLLSFSVTPGASTSETATDAAKAAAAKQKGIDEEQAKTKAKAAPILSPHL